MKTIDECIEFVKRNNIEFVNKNKIEIKKDTKTQKFFYFKNCWLEVTQNGYIKYKYSELPKFTCINQLLNRKFSENKTMGVFEKFILRVCGHRDKSFNTLSDTTRDRFICLKTYIGYLLHNYYDYELFAVVFTDSKISNDNRTGKDLTLSALKYILNTFESSHFVEISGKDFSIKNFRRYEDCETETQLITINDLSNNTNVEMFFYDIAEGISIHKQCDKPFKIRTKIGISTNKIFNIDNESAKARIKQFEFSEWYNSEYSPVMEFGKWFFREWDDNEYNSYFTFIIDCCSSFLKYGLLEAKP